MVSLCLITDCVSLFVLGFLRMWACLHETTGDTGAKCAVVVVELVLIYWTCKPLVLLDSQPDRKGRINWTPPPASSPRFFTHLLKEFLSGARCPWLQRAA